MNNFRIPCKQILFSWKVLDSILLEWRYTRNCLILNAERVTPRTVHSDPGFRNLSFDFGVNVGLLL